jgi:hypothetical protein
MAPQSARTVSRRDRHPLRERRRSRRWIWRGEAELKDGRAVYVTLDLEGGLYSGLSRLMIEVRPARVPVPSRVAESEPASVEFGNRRTGRPLG